MALALRHRLPTMSVGRHYAEAGSLLAYGAYARELCQRSAVFVDKILKGTKPADLPIERAEFKLVVNLKTAEALGLTLPPLFLFRADEVSVGARRGAGWGGARGQGHAGGRERGSPPRLRGAPSRTRHCSRRLQRPLRSRFQARLTAGVRLHSWKEDRSA